jgi:[ribosomal protein S5]-alanine N-acetyltransferase
MKSDKQNKQVNLKTSRLVLRQPMQSDAHNIFALRSNPIINQFIERPITEKPEDSIDFIQYIKEMIEENQCYYWGLQPTDSDFLIGTICFWSIDWVNKEAEIGYELMPKFQRQGYMQEAFDEILNFGFEILQLKSIIAFPHPRNKPSINLLKKKGFRFIKDEGGSLVYILEKDNKSNRKKNSL